MSIVVPACDLIGHEGEFRLPGGRTVYSDVMYDDASARSDRPRLAYLKSTKDGLHQVNRYVGWNDLVEVLRDYTAEYEAEREAEYVALEAQDG